MKNLWLLLGSLACTLLAVIVVSVLFTNKASAPTPAVDSALLEKNATHAKGKSDAKVTIVEFSDFQCPACKAVQPLLKQIETQNKDSLRIVYRHFPLKTTHKNALLAAKASEAAGNQEKFWEYHDTLFTSQTEWEGEKDPTTQFVSYAKQLGLDEEKFKKDLNNSDLEKKITLDEQDGLTLNVNSTPTFFVNGVKTDANMLQAKITELLQ